MASGEGGRDVAEATSLVDLGIRACEAYGRTDLAARLGAARHRLADPAAHVVVMGEFKQGKSSLINALVRIEACPVDDDVATALPMFVRHGSRRAARLRFEGGESTTIAWQDVRQWTVEAPAGRAVAEPTSPDEQRPTSLEVQVPARLLAEGMVLVDTPGIGGLGSAYAAASLHAASLADAVLFVTDAAQELTRTELDVLRQVRDLTSRVVCVLTKIDLYPAWRVVAELDRTHLAELDVPLLSVSSSLRRTAVVRDDPSLDDESGVPRLEAHLRDRTGVAAADGVMAAAQDVADVCSHLRAQFEAERAALVDPERARSLVADLEAARKRVEELRSTRARWSLTLTDGISDLAADVNHDLRGRVRNVVQEADEAIDASDPADTWPEMASWLEARLGHELLATHLLLRRRADVLAGRIARQFDAALAADSAGFTVPSVPDAALDAPVDAKIDLARMNVGLQAMVALRNAYGGAVAFLMLGSLAGVTLAPVAVGIGLVMGRRGLREEKRRQRAARQAQARNAVRRYCDQVEFAAGKDLRDVVNRIQRHLRDHYAAVATRLERSHAEALERAEAALRHDDAERAQQVADVDAELQRLDRLRQQAQGLASSGGSRGDEAGGP